MKINEKNRGKKILPTSVFYPEETLYNNVLKKSKNENYKNIIALMKNGKTYSYAIEKTYNLIPYKVMKKVDPLFIRRSFELSDSLTKEEKIYLYHLKNSTTDSQYPKDACLQDIFENGICTREHFVPFEIIENGYPWELLDYENIQLEKNNRSIEHYEE